MRPPEPAPTAASAVRPPEPAPIATAAGLWRERAPLKTRARASGARSVQRTALAQAPSDGHKGGGQAQRDGAGAGGSDAVAV